MRETGLLVQEFHAKAQSRKEKPQSKTLLEQGEREAKKSGVKSTPREMLARGPRPPPHSKMVASTEKSEPLILAIETATRSGGVAVARGEQVLASRTGDAAVSHSANLIEMIEEVLDEADVKLSEVDLFAVAVGPGSFTGLRIGLATVKAFAAHLKRKVAGVSTLAAVAHASGADGEIVSLLPAGRGEVFAQRFSVDETNVAAMDHARHLSPSALIEQYGEIERLTLAGEGVRMFEKFGVPASGESNKKEDGPPEGGTPNTPPEGGTPNLQQGGTLNLQQGGTLNLQFRGPLNEGWIVIDESPNLAPSIALLGFRNYREGKLVAPEDLRAVYVRASDAEINEQWQRQKAPQPAPG